MYQNLKFFNLIRLNQSSSFFFLAIVFESNNFFFLSKFFFLKNLQFVYMFSSLVLKFFYFFLELNVASLIDVAAFDSRYLASCSLIKNFNSILHCFYSYFGNSYKFIFAGFSKKIYSLNKFFFNAAWLEREVCEFFGYYFYNQYDCRNLLLEYGFNEPILLKKYEPLLGSKFYNKFYNKLIISYNYNFFN